MHRGTGAVLGSKWVLADRRRLARMSSRLYPVVSNGSFHKPRLAELASTRATQLRNLARHQRCYEGPSLRSKTTGTWLRKTGAQPRPTPSPPSPVPNCRLECTGPDAWGVDGREQTVEASAPAPAEDARGESPVEKESRKRRAPNADGSTAKRQRKTRDEPAGGPEAQDARPRTDAGPRSSAATQEEKRRGKRLFGGLLNTLSQEAGNSQQQRRRHEIEQRQLAKMQRQAADDDKRRAEKRATLHDVRVRQQITWEESVVRLTRQ